MAPGGAPRQAQPGEFEQPTGRWPANVLVDEHAATMLDEQSGQLVSGANPTRRGSDKSRDVYGDFAGQAECTPARGLDIGGASRFYYCAKATRAEREAGLAFMEATGRSDDGYGSIQRPKLDRRSPRENWTPRERRNVHPTVKPIDVMRWLCRLITPAGGTVLDPFAGSGTTGCAAMLEGLRFVGVEREPEYVAIAEGRIAHWLAAGPAALDQPRPRPAAAREDMPTLWDHHETKADEDAA
jgi:site-specific DNA-methyltransferase (adenine-specific)